MKGTLCSSGLTLMNWTLWLCIFTREEREGSWGQEE
ncbi:hypothetical protein POPTR_010G034950v4 [Populus trichocarpa]|uniref:Uncharacterized protein n=1 Tax=Populus trichocarpa TaxID=3694 RepID=A0ACC0SBN5_POPTR|nr:hypothetical protein POPTR_010G034950v4 [Populus trichocarpa]